MSAVVLSFLDEIINCFDIQSPYQIFERLGSPKYILAPMVLQSELAFRMFCRKHGTTLCYTPMLTSSELILDYETHGNIQKSVISCKEDRPLVVQLCSANVVELTKAALIIERNLACDAIDINLGCPQTRALRDNFGAFLMSQPNTVYAMIRSLVTQCKLPIFAKIRLLSTFEETLQFVKMLEKAGVSLVAIHGRQIKDKNKGSADLEMIRLIKAKCCQIPVISNGNIRTFRDVEDSLQRTKCDGIMSAEGIRINPYLFADNDNIHSIDLCWEYLEFVTKYGVIDMNSVNKHILYFCKKYLMDLDYEFSQKCKYRRRKIGRLRKLLRWPKLVNTMIQFQSILDTLERIVDKKPFKHPKIKIFTFDEIRKKPGYIRYWHKHNKKFTQCNEE